MNNKTILYLGIAGLAYYLFIKSNKKITLTVAQIQSLSTADLNNLQNDLGKNGNKYTDPIAYTNYVTAEKKRRAAVTSGGGTTTTGGGGATTTGGGSVLSF